MSESEPSINTPVITNQPTSGQPQGLPNTMGPQYQMGMPLGAPLYPMGMPLVGPQYCMGMPLGGPQYLMGMPYGGPQYPMGMPYGGPQYQMGMPFGGQQYPIGMGVPQTQMGMVRNPAPQIPPIPGVPPGLEYLSVIQSLFVRQQIEVLEVVTGYHMPNKYDVFKGHGELIYRAIEIPGNSAICGSNREFHIVVYDLMGRQLMKFYRPTACCFQEILTVTGPGGTPFGSIDPQSDCSPTFLVKNASGQAVLQITGLGCNCCHCGTVDFNVYSMDGKSQVGKITKQWAGYFQEVYTAATNFGMNFPLDLDVCVKATLLGACVLMDFMYFENAENSINTSG